MNETQMPGQQPLQQNYDQNYHLAGLERSTRAKIHFMVLALLKFQNVNWFIRNTDFPVKSFWRISNVFRPKTPPTTPRSLFWHINCGVTKWKITHYKYAFRWLSSSYNIHTVELKERVNIALVWDYPLLVSQFSSSSVLQSIISS